MRAAGKKNEKVGKSCYVYRKLVYYPKVALTLCLHERDDRLKSQKGFKSLFRRKRVNSSREVSISWIKMFIHEE